VAVSRGAMPRLAGRNGAFPAGLSQHPVTQGNGDRIESERMYHFNHPQAA